MLEEDGACSRQLLSGEAYWYAGILEDIKKI